MQEYNSILAIFLHAHEEDHDDQIAVLVIFMGCISVLLSVKKALMVFEGDGKEDVMNHRMTSIQSLLKEGSLQMRNLHHDEN